MTDGELLAEFARMRSEDAFAEVVHRHERMVYGVCLRVTGSTALSEEAAQATFMVLARKAAAVAKMPDAGGWLHRVADNIARRAREAETRRRAHEREAAAMRSQQSPPAGENALAAISGLVDAELLSFA